MIKICYIGSENSLKEISGLLKEEITVSASEQDADLTIYEIASIDNLYSTPKTYKHPVFLYIVKKDDNILAEIKNYPVSGLFFPPLTKKSILAKLRSLSLKKTITRNPEDYESLRIKIIAKSESIPPLPTLAQELIKLTADDNMNLSFITDKIKQDQGISTSLIKLVNSPFYGLRQEVSSIDRAASLLGFNSIKNIAIAVSMNQYFNKPFNMYNTSGKAMWLHSYNVACISQIIATVLKCDEDALYLAGLLHDVGKIILIDFLVKPVKSIEDEQTQLGFNHAEVAALILQKWMVSEEVVEAVKTHHQFDAKAFGKILYFANKLDNNKEFAEDIVNEMQLVLGIENFEKAKPKILSIIRDVNELF